jgi:hypothetical protein
MMIFIAGLHFAKDQDMAGILKKGGLYYFFKYGKTFLWKYLRRE